MMPGVGFLETVLLVLVAIIVIGPKDLPLMMRKFGRFTGKMRAMAFEFKQGIDELGRQAELEELRKEVADLKKHTGLEDLQKDFEQDQLEMRGDVDSLMMPGSSTPESSTPESSTSGSSTPATPAIPEHPAGAANGAAEPPATPPYAGLSADHPGYDAGDDFRIDGHPQEAAPEPAPVAEAAPAPEPVKQDTPA